MANALKKCFKGEIEFQIPQGGMFLWVKFQDEIDTMELFNFTIKDGVAFVPGVVFFSSAKSSQYARFNFTNATHKEIESGIKRLKKGYLRYKKLKV
jgi:2-aminoadipate transaminase